MKRLDLNKYMQLRETADGLSLAFKANHISAVLNMTQMAEDRGRIVGRAMIGAMEAALLDDVTTKTHSNNEVRFLVKNLKTGEVDIETQHPVSKVVCHNTPLVEGYVWTKVITTYTEV
jgi:hypothetical protein